MVEYALVLGRNFFGGFLSSIEPGIIPIQGLFAKMGLTLSAGEACFALLFIIALVVGSLVLLIIK